jgi:hypothetical protein
VDETAQYVNSLHRRLAAAGLNKRQLPPVRAGVGH